MSLSYLLSSWLDFCQMNKDFVPEYWIVVDFSCHILTRKKWSGEIYENGIRQGCLAPLALGMV